MKFTSFLKPINKNDIEEIDQLNEHIIELKEKQDPSEILRSNGFKIKLVTRTSFGTQVDLAKKYNPDDVSKALEGFNIKIKGQSIFIVE